MQYSNSILINGMIKINLAIGFILGIAACILGIFLFLHFFTDYGFVEGVKSMQAQGQVGKLITLGAMLDLVIFGILMKMNQDIMARGIVLAVICITIYTIIA
jgi:hypothetical protein